MKVLEREQEAAAPNPWGLSEGEVRALQTLIEQGSQKCAALELGCHISSLSRIITRAQEKMAARTHLKAVLTFDRWLREAA